MTIGNKTLANAARRFQQRQAYRGAKPSQTQKDPLEGYTIEQLREQLAKFEKETAENIAKDR